MWDGLLHRNENDKLNHDHPNHHHNHHHHYQHQGNLGEFGLPVMPVNIRPMSVCAAKHFGPESRARITFRIFAKKTNKTLIGSLIEYNNNNLCTCQAWHPVDSLLEIPLKS